MHHTWLPVKRQGRLPPALRARSMQAKIMDTMTRARGGKASPARYALVVSMDCSETEDGPFSDKELAGSGTGGMDMVSIAPMSPTAGARTRKPR